MMRLHDGSISAGLKAVLWCARPGRAGPSNRLEEEMLPVMLDHVIATFFPEIWQANNGDALEVAQQPTILGHHDSIGCF